jgi:hypothetical protein
VGEERISIKLICERYNMPEGDKWHGKKKLRKKGKGMLGWGG